ncbi:MAG: HEAT repeat domain-containing protein, partial [Pyrinomonadaceae bacterium]|nr:HEAT repeat domain-containing protein [Phycisphaerales bacterium]
SKIQAIEAIGRIAPSDVSPDVAASLLSFARDNRQHVSVQSAAASALGKVGPPNVVAKLIDDAPSDARVRKVVVELIEATYDKTRADANDTPGRLIDNLRRFARSDKSYGVRSAALRTLGKIGGGDSKSIIVEALKSESQNDQVRQAALDALGSLNDKDGLPLAVRATEASSFPRTRPTAIGAVATLAHHDPELAFNTLKVLLNDPADRTAKAAGDALVKLGDPRAIELFQQKAASAPTPVIRDQSHKWATDLQTKVNAK